ncbi:MAG: EamA family transporter [Alphaproteobacteria bacterium]|nr:MAG: EamA family transporter [Alphaproteobacteria bacterium]
MKSPSSARTVLLTTLAMLAFAANSVLCRLALGAGLIDAASFTTVRGIAGAVTLSLILWLRQKTTKKTAPKTNSSWRPAVLLFTYMAFFSFAYVSLAAGTGALILFGAVQLTMFIVALRSGEPFSPLSWAGLSLAIGGLVYLVSPGLTAPDPLGALMMAIAGMAWGFYSLSGRGTTDPLASTTRNFAYSVPLVIVVSLIFLPEFNTSPTGLILAVVAGALTSGCGYVIWYAVLPALSATRAATIQLSVPAIATLGGVMLLAEPVSLRLALATAATLGGVAIVLSQRTKPITEKN